MLLSSASARQSDDRLASRVAGGDADAFTEIVERYRPELLRVARWRLGPERAEDVVQQAFLQAWGALQRGATISHLRGWLHQILRHVISRSGGREPTVVPLEDERLVGEPLETIVERRRLLRQGLDALAALPETQRTAVIAAIRGDSRSDVAATLGISEGAARQLLFRARTSLRAAVAGLAPIFWRRWPGSGSAAVAELPLAAGGVVGGGVALKLGVVLTAGVAAVAGGVVVPSSSPSPRPTARSAQSAPQPARAAVTAARTPHVAQPERVAATTVTPSRLTTPEAREPAPPRPRSRGRRSSGSADVSTTTRPVAHSSGGPGPSRVTTTETVSASATQSQGGPGPSGGGGGRGGSGPGNGGSGRDDSEDGHGSGA